MAFRGGGACLLAAAAALVGALHSAAALPLQNVASEAPPPGMVAPEAAPHEQIERLNPLTQAKVSDKESIEPFLRDASAARTKVLLGPPRTNISIALARKTHDLELHARLSRTQWDLAPLKRTLDHACTLRANVSAALPRTRSMVRALVRTSRDMDDRLMNYTTTLAEMRRLQRLRFAVNVPAPLRRELGNVAHASRIERPRLRFLFQRTHAFRERVETLARSLHNVVRETRLLRWSCTHCEASVGLVGDAAERLDADFAQVEGGIATLRLKHRDCQRKDQERWASHIEGHSRRDLAEGDDASVSAHLSVYRLYLALDDCLREVWHTDLEPVQRELATFSRRAREVGERLAAARSDVTRTDRRSRDNNAEHERIRRTAAGMPHDLVYLLHSVQAEVHRLQPMLLVHQQIMRQHGEEWRQLYEQRNLTMHEIMHELTRERREEVQRKLEFEHKRQVRLNEEEEKLKAKLVKIRKQSVLDSWFAGNFTVPGVPPVPEVPHVKGPSCTSYTDCADCLAVEWCGWCGMTAQCFEGTEEDGPIFGTCAFHWRHTHGTQCDGSRRPPANVAMPDDVPHYIGPEDMDERAVECERRKWDALEPAFNGSKEWHYDERPDLWLPETDLPDFCKRPLHYSGMWPKMQKAWRYQMQDGVGEAEAERERTRARLRKGAGTRVAPNTVDAHHRPVVRASGSGSGSGSGSLDLDGTIGMGVGMRVQARFNYPVGQEYYRGTIQSLGEDGTMSIRYDNGLTEDHVLRAAVMRLPEDVNADVLPKWGPDPDKLRADLTGEIYDPRDGAAQLKPADLGERIKGLGKDLKNKLSTPNMPGKPKLNKPKLNKPKMPKLNKPKMPKLEKPKLKKPDMPKLPKLGLKLPKLKPPKCEDQGHIACTLNFKCCWYQPVNVHRPMVDLDPPGCRKAGQCESTLPGDLPPMFVPPPPVVPPPPPPPKGDDEDGSGSSGGSSEGEDGGNAGQAYEPPKKCPDDMCSSVDDCNAKRAECADVLCLRCIDEMKQFLTGAGSSAVGSA